MTQALYNKWRPQKWDEVIGQQHVIQTLRNAVGADRVAHAYLFAGPRGTGKTTAARLLAKAVNCLEPDLAKRPCNECAHCKAVNEGRFLDLIEIDAASNTSVEDVRDLRDKINFSPNQGKYKVYIIDEVHMLSTAAFNALLKTLEEPPPHAIFILATTEIHKIPATVLSRCQRHEFRRVPVDEIVGQLKRIAETEKLTAEPEALTLIARQSSGGMRDAISLLDQMASTGKEITLGLTQTVLGTATSQTVLALVEALQEHKPAMGMDAIHASLDAGTDPRLLGRQVVDYLRALLLIQMGNAAQVDLAAETRAMAEKQARKLTQAEVLRMIKAFNAAATDLRGGWQPALPLEMALAELMEAPEAAAVPAQVQTTMGRAQTGQEKQALAEKPAQLEKQTPPVERPQPEKKNPVANKPATEKKPEKQSENQPEKQPPPPKMPGTGSSPSITLEQVIRAWRQICGLIKPQSFSLDGLLHSCRLLEVKGDVLIVGFQSEILRSKADTPEQIKITSKAIHDVLNVDLDVRCVVTNSKHEIPPDIKADGMVAAALKHGGEIVE
jgi:DNA polymerase III subunit gamma/tau